MGFMEEYGELIRTSKLALIIGFCESLDMTSMGGMLFGLT
jgi:hypothetical protein